MGSAGRAWLRAPWQGVKYIVTELKKDHSYKITDEGGLILGVVRFEWFRPVTTKFESAIAGWLEQSTLHEDGLSVEIELKNLSFTNIETNETLIVKRSFIAEKQNRVFISAIHDWIFNKNQKFT